MVQLFIIADDFTGALDTGVQLAKRGACVKVITDPKADLAAFTEGYQVLVMDAETRHIPAAEAYSVVYRAARQAVELGIPHILKKTDSALRGNIGAELSAVLDAAGCDFLPFLPAFPQNNRVTRGGVHYINGKPVAESVFGQDPFEPVTESDVVRMIALQSETPAVSRAAMAADAEVPAEKGIVVYDAESLDDLAGTGRALMKAGRLTVMAGCAGFGVVLPELLGLIGEDAKVPPLGDRFTVICGSVNPITLAQLADADENGFAHVHITPEQKLTEGWFDSEAGQAKLREWSGILAENRHVIFDANDEGGNAPTSAWAEAHGLTVSDLRVRIAFALGRIMKGLFHDPNLGTLLVTGGDTLLQCMDAMGVYAMEPICELYSGVVLSRFSLDGIDRYVISKSGGFGQPTLFRDMVTSFMS